MTDTTDRTSRNQVFSSAEQTPPQATTTPNRPPNVQPGMPTRNVMEEDFGYTVPIEAVPLPSRGVIYPTDTSVHGTETLQLRAMTAREEDILTSRALIKKGTVITHLLKSCIVDRTVDVDSLITGDRNALMTALRITGYGATYKVEVSCPQCGEKSKQDFDLTDLPIKRLLIQPIADGSNLFEFELPVTKKKVHFKFLTGNDEQEILVTNERKKKSGMSTDNLVTTRLKYSIVSIENITDKSKISMFIRNMPARDSLELRKFIDNNEPGIEMKSWMECPHCTEHSEVRLPMGASFFWPNSD